MSKKLPIFIGDISAPSGRKAAHSKSDIDAMVEIIEKNNRLVEELAEAENEARRK